MPWAAGTQATQPASPADLTPVVAGTQTANTSHLWNQPLPILGSDTAHATDVVTRLVSIARTVSDIAHATDVASRSSLRSASDSATLTDAVARLLALHRTGTDAAGATDATTRGFARTGTDLAHATDVASRSASVGGTASDIAHATDVASRAMVYLLGGVAHGVGGASGNLSRLKPLGGIAHGVGGGGGNLTYWIGLAGTAHGVGGATGALVIVRAPDNDPFANPTNLAGATGTVALVTVADTYQLGEPDPQVGTGSVWYIFTASGDGTLHVGTSQTPAPAWQTRVDVYTGPSIDALVSVALGDLTSDPQAGVPDSQTGGTDLMVSSGVTYRIRVQDAGQGRFDGVLDWAWAAVPVVPPAPNVTLESTTVSTYSVQINAANLTPGQVLTFNLLNATLVDLGLLSDTVTADDSGSVHAASVSIIPPTGPLPASGNYTLVAHAVPDVSLPLTLTLLEPDVPQPLPTAPSPVPTVAVQRWVFQDVTPGASVASWTVPLNPFDMTSPFGDKNISDEGTVSPEGQTLIFEGMTKPVDWSFTGWVLDETHYNDLEYWHARPYRVYIVDHYKRAWEVYIYSLDIKPVVGVNKPWKHQYTMKVRITRGPIQL